MKQIRLNADRSVLASHGVGGLVVVRSDDDHRIDVGMVGAQREIEQIVKANTGSYGFEPERIGLCVFGKGLGCVVHAPAAMSICPIRS
jgi:hypothetical protein